MNSAIRNAPSTVIIRDLDVLGSSGDKTTKVLNILAAQMARVEGDLSVCIIGLARQLVSLPEVLKKTDVFRQHMTLPIPSL
jgi:SpoVK/Ycf46/Vps4 family AAA+-type ATPase